MIEVNARKANRLKSEGKTIAEIGKAFYGRYKAKEIEAIIIKPKKK